MIIKSREPPDGKAFSVPTFDPDSLIGRTFLLNPNDNGETFHAKVKSPVINQQAQSPDEHLQFLLSVGEDQPDELVTYNHLMDLLQREVDKDIQDDMWIFTEIIGHKGPLNQKHENYKGSKYNVKVQ